MTTHEQIHIMNQMLNGAFQECIYITLTWVAYSFYSHVLSLLNVQSHSINPYDVGASIQYDKEQMREVLKDIIVHAKEEEMKLKPVKKLSTIIRNLEADEPIVEVSADLSATLYTIRELKKLASQQKVKGYSNLTKSELLKVVQLPN